MATATGIGASILRKEDRRFLTGRGNYVSDVKRPNMTWAAFARSPHAHAKIMSIDSGDAMKVQGVAPGSDRRGSCGGAGRVDPVRLGHYRS